MGLKTLKIGDTVTVKDNNQTGVISSIERGAYQLKGSKLFYSSRDLEAEKKKIGFKQKKTPINKASDKTGKLQEIYRFLRDRWLPHNKLCRARFASCTVKATECHHMNGRKGYWLIISKYFLPICRNCHRKATKDSAMAIKAGISLPDHANPEYEFNNLERQLMEKAGITPPI